MHTKKTVKGTDLYKGPQAVAAEEAQKRKNQEAAQFAREAFLGKKFRKGSFKPVEE